MAQYIVIRGAVLRETVTRESDKILTVLTAELGKIPVIARGVRKKNSKYAACAQSLAYSEWTLYQRGEWYYASDATLLELFEGLRGELEKLSLGFFFAELTEAAAVEGLGAGSLLRHLLNGLYALSNLEKPLPLLKAAFTWRLLALIGYAPLAEGCAVCGREEPEEPVLNTEEGVVCCRSCGTGRPLCAGSLAALRHILYGEEGRLYAFRLGPEALGRLDRAGEAFLRSQLEREFRTLDYYKSLTAAGPE